MNRLAVVLFWIALLAASTAEATQQGVQALVNWKLMDKCVRQAQAAVEQARALHPFIDDPLGALLVDFDPGQTMVKFLVEPLMPKAARLIGVAIHRDHQVFVRSSGARGMFPSLAAGCFQAPSIGFINRRFIGFQGLSPQL